MDKVSDKLRVTSTRQLKERMRYLSDKMESIWSEITPKLMEFSECKGEFNEIIVELTDRGRLEDEYKSSSEV